MSKVLGIISEYNPFHNGHLYHLEESKKLTNPDYTICVMSGNFTQRGNTAIIDKWARTEMALKNGIDLVIELPTVYSTSSAENFALGAIKILNSLKCDTYISFGTETKDLSILNTFADIFVNEPKEYLSILNHELSSGIPYPKARENAILMYLNDVRKYSNILSKSNNILAIEYLKALKILKSNIQPIAVKRIGPEYNSLKVIDTFASATAIRTMITNKKSIVKLLPKSSYEILKMQIRKGEFLLDISNFEREIIYKLRMMSIAEISDLADVSEGLENKIKEASNSCNNLNELISIIKSKRYTYSRISRILTSALLGITKKDISDSYKVFPYIRILGLNNYGKNLLSEISFNSNKKTPIITSVKKFMESNNNKVLKNMLQKDILASNIYTLGYNGESKCNLDYSKKIVTL